MSLVLSHSWPLFERDQRFDFGPPVGADIFARRADDLDRLTALGIGIWDCDLTDNALTWSAGVFDLFGLPRDTPLEREEVAARYAEPSRVAMEELRAHAVKHRRGFTLDAEIVAATGDRRWMRLIAAPVCVGGRATRLQGVKLNVTAAYR